jgi:hypothetical protein
MSSGEWWRWWWGRFHDRLNPRGTWFGIIFIPGPVLIGVGLSSVPGWEWYLGVGVVLLILPFVYAGILAWLAYPPRLNPQEALSRKQALTVITQLPPGCVKVALVGVGDVGKTTLLHHLAAIEPEPAKTKDPEVTLFPAAEPVRWLAYLDAAGQDLTQQFEIMDHADFLILLLDHNSTPTASVSNDRKKQQSFNVDQLVGKIQRLAKGKQVLAIHVLRNKHDLWSRCPGTQAANLDDWFTKQIDKVRGAMPAGTVSDADHSNVLTDDVARVRVKLLELARMVVQHRQAQP